jgi:hypothetical protein
MFGLTDSEKRLAKDWTEKYRFFSHPPASVIGNHPTQHFDPMKGGDRYTYALRARKDTDDPIYKVRPFGPLARDLAPRKVEMGPIARDAINLEEDQDPEAPLIRHEQLMERCRAALELSRSRSWHQNYPIWRKYHYFGGGMVNSNRYTAWMGQVKDGDEWGLQIPINENTQALLQQDIERKSRRLREPVLDGSRPGSSGSRLSRGGSQSMPHLPPVGMPLGVNAKTTG